MLIAHRIRVFHRNVAAHQIGSTVQAVRNRELDDVLECAAGVLLATRHDESAASLRAHTVDKWSSLRTTLVNQLTQETQQWRERMVDAGKLPPAKAMAVDMGKLRTFVPGKKPAQKGTASSRQRRRGGPRASGRAARRGGAAQTSEASPSGAAAATAGPSTSTDAAAASDTAGASPAAGNVPSSDMSQTADDVAAAEFAGSPVASEPHDSQDARDASQGQKRKKKKKERRPVDTNELD